MDKPFNIPNLLEHIRRNRREWEALLAQFSDAQMAQPLLAGGWKLKDVIAHITWHEKEMIGLLQTRKLAGSELWNLPTDERNAAIYEQNRARSLGDVRSEAQAVFDQLMVLLAAVTEEVLLDPAHFAGMPSDWRPLDIVAQNTYEHYKQHIPAVRELVA